MGDKRVRVETHILPLASSDAYRTLRDDLRVSIVYITHDLATAYYISDRLVIMQKGRVVESGEALTVLSAPKHPYSILLKSSVLSPDAAGGRELAAPSAPQGADTSVKAL